MADTARVATIYYPQTFELEQISLSDNTSEEELKYALASIAQTPYGQKGISVLIKLLTPVPTARLQK
jgi:hypothetical protein